MRTWGGAAVLLVVLVFLASGEAAPVPVVRGDKWEYCEIQYSYTPARSGAPKGGGARVVRPAQTTILWITGTEETEATGWEDMAQKMKAPAGRQNASESAQRMRVLNHMGSQGWELVTTTRDSSSYISPQTWIFKRKAK
jgi:hypothetical protein